MVVLIILSALKIYKRVSNLQNIVLHKIMKK